MEAQPFVFQSSEVIGLFLDLWIQMILLLLGLVEKLLGERQPVPQTC